MPVIADWDDAYVNAASHPGRRRLSGSLGEGGGGVPGGVAGGSAARGAALRPARAASGSTCSCPRGLRAGWWSSCTAATGGRFDRDLWSHLAAGPVARGWIVAMPGYPLAPEARIAEITRSIAEAVTQLAAAMSRARSRWSGIPRAGIW